MFATSLFAIILITGCASEKATKTEKSDNVATEIVTAGTKTVVAKFIDAGSLEGDADFTFEKEDGSKIFFYRNYFDTKEPALNFEFLGEDGASANKTLVGSTFLITYKENPKGRISMESGEGEPCNQILTVEKK